MDNLQVLTTLNGDILEQRAVFESRLVDTSIRFDIEAGFAVQAMQDNDYLLTTAYKNRQSMVDAVNNVAAIGISLNPAKKQAYLVPRKNRVCLDISYIGLMDLAMSTGSILWGQALVVRKQDRFELRGIDIAPLHQYDPFSTERGEIVGVYVVVKTATGDYLTHTMAIDAVYAIRDRSEAWKNGQKGPWKTDTEEMIKKTCVKQAYKYWPKNDRLDAAIQHVNTENAEGIDFAAERGEVKKSATDYANGARTFGDDSDRAAALVDRLEAVANSGDKEALAAAWGALSEQDRAAVGAPEWRRINALSREARQRHAEERDAA